MKKMVFLLLGALMGCGLYAQVVEQDEPAIIYYSPKTMVTLDFSYTVETWEKGPYAIYAEEMIGVTNAIKNNQSTYTLTDVHIKTNTQTDYTRPHKVVAETGFPLLLSLNEKGLLIGYNIPAAEKKTDKNHTYRDAKPDKHPAEPLQAIPYPEEMLKAATPQAKARAVAKQIYHLRETRMYLINGEVENAPADGEAMQLVLDELDKQEKQLTALFIGKKQKYTDHKIIRFDPATEKPVLFFSEENGFTGADNIDADSICIRINKRIQKATPAPVTDKKDKKKAVPELSQIQYNLPGSADIQVVYQNQTLRNSSLSIAQFGIDVPLAKDLFKGSELPVIVFSEQTGNIVSISK